MKTQYYYFYFITWFYGNMSLVCELIYRDGNNYIFYPTSLNSTKIRKRPTVNLYKNFKETLVAGKPMTTIQERSLRKAIGVRNEWRVAASYEIVPKVLHYFVYNEDGTLLFQL